MLTNAAALGILQCISGKKRYYSMNSGAIYLGLSSTEPDYAGSNFTEPDADEYARVQVVVSSSTQSSDSGTNTNSINYFGTPAYDEANACWSVTNTKVIQFDEAVSDWGTLTHFGLFTAASGGTPFFVGELDNTDSDGNKVGITVTGSEDEGKVALFRAGELTIKINED